MACGECIEDYSLAPKIVCQEVGLAYQLNLVLDLVLELVLVGPIRNIHPLKCMDMVGIIL